MTHSPHGPHRRNEWLHFFLGTPRRFFWTLVGAFIIFAMIAPGAAGLATTYVVNAAIVAFGPVLAALLPFLVVALGFWVMFRPLSRKKKGTH